MKSLQIQVEDAIKAKKLDIEKLKNQLVNDIPDPVPVKQR